MIRKRIALLGVLTLVASVFVQSSGTASAATLVGDYRFQGTFSSSVGTAPPLQHVGNDGTPSPTFTTETVLGQQRQVWLFPRLDGLSLNTQGVIANDSYSVATLFRFDEIASYRSILNFTNGISDSGLYNLTGNVVLFSGFSTDELVMEANRYVQVVFTRDAAKNFAVYVGGQLVLSGVDDTDRSLIDAANQLWFFADGGGNNEASAGAVARIRVWDGPLTAQEAQSLDDTPPPISVQPAPECQRDPSAQCGTTGDDDVSTNNGTVITGAGDDTIEGIVDAETSELIIDSGSGNDEITLNIETSPELPITVRVLGGGGADVISIPRSPGTVSPNLVAGGGNDVIKVFTPTESPRPSAQTGTPGRYVIDSGDGNDRVTSGTSADRIKSAAGNDKVDGGAGNDAIDAGGGTDELEGGEGNDDLGGGGGADVLHGGDGANDFAGGPGTDTCLSDTRQDEFTGCERIRRNHRRNHGQL